jgi:hypothetical protein
MMDGLGVFRSAAVLEPRRKGLNIPVQIMQKSSAPRIGDSGVGRSNKDLGAWGKETGE